MAAEGEKRQRLLGAKQGRRTPQRSALVCGKDGALCQSRSCSHRQLDGPVRSAPPRWAAKQGGQQRPLCPSPPHRSLFCRTAQAGQKSFKSAAAFRVLSAYLVSFKGIFRTRCPFTVAAGGNNSTLFRCVALERSPNGTASH